MLSNSIDRATLDRVTRAIASGFDEDIPYREIAEVVTAIVSGDAAEQGRRPQPGTPEKRFAFVSQGRTASHWLAAALDAHPEISCGHSRSDPPIPNYRAEATGVAKTRDEVAETATALPGSPEGYYRFLERHGPGPIFGTVHAFSVGSVTNLLEAGVRTALLTRHPITRCDSFANRRQVEMEYSAVIRGRSLASVIAATKHFPLAREVYEASPTDEVHAFIAGCFDVGHESMNLSKFMWVVPSERITADPDYFAWVLYHVVGVKVTQPYLDDVFSMGKLNTLSELRTNALSVFAAWPEWKKRFFRATAERFKMHNFESIGYDVSGIMAACSEGGDGWRDFDADPVAAAKSGEPVVMNLGVSNPDTIRVGSRVDIYLKITGAKATIQVGELMNSTGLLHTSLPKGRNILKLSFAAPAVPGTYPLRIYGRDGAIDPDKHRPIIDTVLTVVGPDMRLKDHGLLRATIQKVG